MCVEQASDVTIDFLEFIYYVRIYIHCHMELACVYVNAFLFDFLWAFGLRCLYVVHIYACLVESWVHVHNYRRFVEKLLVFL